MPQPTYAPQPASAFNSKLLFGAAIGVAGVSLITSTYLWYKQRSLECIIAQNNANFLEYKQQWQDTCIHMNQEKVQLAEQHSNTLRMLAQIIEKFPSTNTIIQLQQTLDNHERTLQQYRKFTRSFIYTFFDYRDESRTKIAHLYNLQNRNAQSYAIETESDDEDTETANTTQSEDEKTPDESPKIYNKNAKKSLRYSKESLNGARTNLYADTEDIADNIEEE